MTAPAYVIGSLRDVELGDDIFDYISRIELTMAEYGGRFLVHGGALTPLEGSWDGDLVILEFPDRDTAQRWYDSPGYQEILPLRTRHAHSLVAVVEGVPAGYRAADKIPQLLGLLTG